MFYYVLIEMGRERNVFNGGFKVWIEISSSLERVDVYICIWLVIVFVFNDDV